MNLFFLTPHIFANGPHLVATSGDQNRVKTAPHPIFARKRRLVLMHIDHSTFYWPSQYLSSFPSNGPKSKKFPFLTDFLVRPQKKSFGLEYAQF